MASSLVCVEFPYDKIEEKVWKNYICKMLWTDGVTPFFFFLPLDRLKIAFSKSEYIYIYILFFFFLAEAYSLR